jgi:hypothetical protein
MALLGKNVERVKSKIMWKEKQERREIEGILKFKKGQNKFKKGQKLSHIWVREK